MNQKTVRNIFILSIASLVFGPRIYSRWIIYDKYITPMNETHEYLTYKQTPSWRSVSKILSSREGDCADFSTLLMHKLKKLRNVKMLIVSHETMENTHAVVLVNDNLVLDPTANAFYSYKAYKRKYHIEEVLTYKEINKKAKKLIFDVQD